MLDIRNGKGIEMWIFPARTGGANQHRNQQLK